jgi:hypothetical protein
VTICMLAGDQRKHPTYLLIMLPGGPRIIRFQDLDWDFKRSWLKWCHQHPEVMDITKTPPRQIHTPSILYVTLLGVWCWCMLIIHWYFWAPWFRWIVPIVSFYKGVVTSVGRVSFFKDTHRMWISQKIKTSYNWNSKNRPTFVRTF